MKEKSFADRIKVDLSDTKEKEALRKIAGFDKKLQHKTFEDVRKHNDLIVHIRENIYEVFYSGVTNDLEKIYMVIEK